MKRFRIVWLSFFIASCHPSMEKQANEINQSIEAVNHSFAENKMDTNLIKAAGKKIEAFADQYKSDTVTARYLFDLGMMYQKSKQDLNALKTFDRVATMFPASKYAANAVFLQGFINANVMYNLTAAKEKYQYYLDHYAAINPKVTEDVRLELQNLGKTPDELLKELQEKNEKGDSSKLSVDSSMRPS